MEGRGAVVCRKYVFGLKWQVALWMSSLAYLDSHIPQLIIRAEWRNNAAINIMLSDRSRSASRLVYPQTRDVFARRLEELQEHNRQLLSKQSMRSSKRPTSTAAYPLSSQNNRYLRSSLNYHRPLGELQQEVAESRPFTQSDSKRGARKSASPLSIIKSRQHGESAQRWQMFKSTKQLKKNFLRKGSSIDKAILSNVLKSKINLNVCPSTFSYGDVPGNSNILKLVKQQIPRGMKDVVGAQEMMRMSHIMTGVRFKTLNLTQRLNTILHDHRTQPQQPQEEDNITLKSIKRW